MEKTTDEAFGWVKSLSNWPTDKPDDALCKRGEGTFGQHQINLMFSYKGNRWPTISPAVYAANPTSVVRFQKWYNESEGR